MKNHYQLIGKSLGVLYCLMIVFGINNTVAQSIKIQNQTHFLISEGTELTVPGDAIIESGANMTIAGNVTIDGGLVCTDNSAINVASTATNDGSLIFGSGTPNATINRYVGPQNWHQVSIPVTEGITANNFHFNYSPSTWLMRHNEYDDSWVYITELTQELKYGEGFDLFMESAETVDFEGPITANDFTLSGSTTLPILRTDDSHGYNLIGNPYSCSIDFDSWTLTNMEASIWILDQTGGQGNYRNRTAAGGGNLANGIIPMGQAFFVHATANSPILIIPALKRIHADDSFLKSNNSIISSNYEQYMKLRINSNQAWDEIWVSFGANGSNNFDNGFDCSKMMGDENSPQLYIREEGLQNFLSIDHLPRLDKDEAIVNMSFIAGVDGEQQFVADLSNIFETTVILEDLKENSFTNFTNEPVYTFIASKSDDPDRFRLHFNSSTGVAELSDSPLTNAIKVYSNSNYIYIANTGTVVSGNILDVKVYDIMGRKLFDHSLPDQEMTKINLAVKNAFVVVHVCYEGKNNISKVYIK